VLRTGGPARSSGESQETVVFDGQRNRAVDVNLLVHSCRMCCLLADRHRGKSAVFRSPSDTLPLSGVAGVRAGPSRATAGPGKTCLRELSGKKIFELFF